MLVILLIHKHIANSHKNVVCLFLTCSSNNRTSKCFGDFQQLSCNGISFKGLYMMLLIANISSLVLPCFSPSPGMQANHPQHLKTFCRHSQYITLNIFLNQINNHLPTISSSLFGGQKLFQKSSTARNSVLGCKFSYSSLQWIVSPSFSLLFSSSSLSSYSSSISSTSATISSSSSSASLPFLFSYVWLLEIIVFFIQFFLFSYLFFFFILFPLLLTNCCYWLTNR